MNKRKAKVWTTTKGSSAIILPKDWCNFYKPKEVEVIYDGAILIFPEGFPEESKQRLIAALSPIEEKVEGS